MKTLEQHNQEIRAKHDAMEAMRQPHANGIACPKCSAELWDSNPTMVLSSSPPQKNVHCPSCGFEGYRLV